MAIRMTASETKDAMQLVVSEMDDNCQRRTSDNDSPG